VVRNMLQVVPDQLT
jgi:hypothetical protein